LKVKIPANAPRWIELWLLPPGQQAANIPMKISPQSQEIALGE